MGLERASGQGWAVRDLAHVVVVVGQAQQVLVPLEGEGKEDWGMVFVLLV